VGPKTSSTPAKTFEVAGSCMALASYLSTAIISATLPAGCSSYIWESFLIFDSNVEYIAKISKPNSSYSKGMLRRRSDMASFSEEKRDNDCGVCLLVLCKMRRRLTQSGMSFSIRDWGMAIVYEIASYITHIGGALGASV
jgi:hypothetical protein